MKLVSSVGYVTSSASIRIDVNDPLNPYQYGKQMQNVNDGNDEEICECEEIQFWFEDTYIHLMLDYQ